MAAKFGLTWCGVWFGDQRGEMCGSWYGSWYGNWYGQYGRHTKDLVIWLKQWWQQYRPAHLKVCSKCSYPPPQQLLLRRPCSAII